MVTYFQFRVRLCSDKKLIRAFKRLGLNKPGFGLGEKIRELKEDVVYEEVLRRSREWF